MNILITGAAGYLGSQLTRHLLCEGHDVIAFDNMFYGGEALLFGYSSPALEIVRGDVRNASAIKEQIQKADCLIYLAGIVGEPACNTAPDIAEEINLVAPGNCLHLAEESEIKQVIFISTCSNYGVSAPNALANESSDLNPLSGYAEAKVSTEAYLLGQFTKPCTILRLGTLCGPSTRMRFDLLVNEIARACALNQEIEIYTPEAWRPYLSLRDAIRCIGKVVDNPPRSGTEVYNVVAENLTKSALINTVHKHYPDMQVHYVDKVPDLRDYRVDGSRFIHRFGNLPTTSIEQTFLEVAKAVEQGIFQNPESPIHSAIPIQPFV